MKKKHFYEIWKIKFRALPWRREAGGEQSRVRRPQRAERRGGGGSGRSSPASPTPGSRTPPRRCTSACGNSKKSDYQVCMYIVQAVGKIRLSGMNKQSAKSDMMPHIHVTWKIVLSCKITICKIRLSGMYRYIIQAVGKIRLSEIPVPVPYLHDQLTIWKIILSDM